MVRLGCMAYLRAGSEMSPSEHGIVTGAWGVDAAGRDTLTFFLHDSEGIQVLRDIFRRVAATDLPIELTDIPQVDIPRTRVLIARLTKHPDKHVRRRKGNVVEWNGTVDDWSTNADLLEPFLAGRRGHQFLSDDRWDDVVVIASFGES
jgi:hypothetical protein